MAGSMTGIAPPGAPGVPGLNVAAEAWTFAICPDRGVGSSVCAFSRKNRLIVGSIRYRLLPLRSPQTTMVSGAVDLHVSSGLFACAEFALVVGGAAGGAATAAAAEISANAPNARTRSIPLEYQNCRRATTGAMPRRRQV